MFSDLTKTLSLAFWQTLFKGGLSNLCMTMTFARGLAIYTRFDDLDLIARSQVCQNHKLQIVFRFLSTVVQWCMVTTHVRKIKYSMLYVAGVYLRDITNTFFCYFAFECESSEHLLFLFVWGFFCCGIFKNPKMKSLSYSGVHSYLNHG